MKTALFAALLMQAAASLEQQPPQATPPVAKPPVDWVVLVAAPVYQPDGGITTETVALPPAGAGLVHLFSRKSFCDISVATATEPTDASFGWRVASQVVSRTDRDVVVSLSWRRLWDEGRKTNSGPGGTVQLTLHLGDRIPLDHIANAKPRPDCRAVGLGLEVQVGRGAPPGPATPLIRPTESIAGGAKALDAELWLLHTLPSDVQRVVHQTVRIPVDGGSFSFAPATVTPSVTVEMSGSISRFRTATGDEFLQISLTRRVKGGALPPDGVSQTGGPSLLQLPGPAEVTELQMPGAARGRGGAVMGPGIARGGGGGGGAGILTTPPVTSGGAGGGGAISAVGAGGQRAGGRGGGGGGRGGPTAEQIAEVAKLLEGHQFALRMRVTPVSAQ